MSRDLVQRAVDEILSRIADGRFVAGEALPGEAELAAMLDVSRLTMREAVKVLRERSVLNVIHGRGTYVTERESWTDLGTLIDFTLRTASAREVGLRLVEVRRMIEVGSSGLAARNRSEADLTEMGRALDAIDAAAERGDIETVALEDLAFHRAVMKASGNPFIPAIMIPLESALHRTRILTSSVPEVRERARTHHHEIFRAITSSDEEAAKDAMRSHMTQTRLDTITATAN